MVSDSRTTPDAPSRRPPESSETLVTQSQQQPANVQRPQDKFPRPVRIGLMLGAPVILWAAAYLVWRALW